MLSLEAKKIPTLETLYQEICEIQENNRDMTVDRHLYFARKAVHAAILAQKEADREDSQGEDYSDCRIGG